MAVAQPIATDPLNVPDHSLLHRIIAADLSAPVKSISVDASGIPTLNTFTGPLMGTAGVVSANNSQVRAYSNDVQTLPSTGIFYKVLFQVESYDVGLEFASSRFTATNTGYYLAISQLTFDNFEVGYAFTIAIYKNGNVYTQLTQTVSVDTSFWGFNIQDIIPLSATDYLEVYVMKTGVNSRRIANDASKTFFSIARIA